MSLQVQADRALLRRSAHCTRYLLATVEAPTAPARAQRPALNLAFVIDRSSSMSDGKLSRACEAVLHAIGRLGPADRYSVVAYDDQVSVVAHSSFATEASKQAARDAVQALETGGSTNLSGGWLKGCEMIAEHLHKDAIARCFLLTDGLANRGIVDHDELIGHASALRQRDIVTSTFGVGGDFDEHLLGEMAARGGGAFHFLDNAAIIPRAMDQELGEALEVVARDACLVIDAFGVAVSTLNDFPLRIDQGRTAIELGSLISGQMMQIVVKLRFPTGPAGTQRKVSLSLTDRTGALPQTRVEKVFVHAAGVDVDAQPRAVEVDRAVAAQYAALARREALALNRQGAFERASAVLARCRERTSTYAGEDPELRRIVNELALHGEQFAQTTTAFFRKRIFSSSSNTSRSRGVSSASLRHLHSTSFAVTATTEPQLVAIERAIACLAETFAALKLKARRGRIDTAAMNLGAPLSHAMEFDLARLASESQLECGWHIVFTEHPLQDQWFSHTHASMRAVIVTTHPAAQAADVALDAFVTYEVLLHALQMASPSYDLEGLLHEEERGCLYDLCREHQRLPFKLDAMGLCPSCRAQLDSWGIDAGIVDTAALKVADLQRRASPLLC